MNRPAAKHLRLSQTPTKACHGCTGSARHARPPRRRARESAGQGAARERPLPQHDHAAALPRLAGMDVATMKQAMVEIIPRFHDQNRVALDVGYQSPAVPATV